MSFTSTTSGGVTLWVGDPNCQTAHDAILTWLQTHFSSSFRNFSPVPEEPNNRLKGNLGEAIALCVGLWNQFASYRVFPANINPLSDISQPDLDIIWIYFGGSEFDDIAILQEIKTTSQGSLGYADKLLDDYEKLFGTNPQLTLRTRLDAIKSEFEFKLHLPEFCPRIDLLAGNSPRSSSKIKLLPTLIHERQGCNPQKKMIAIRSSLCSASKGWASDSVTAWAIGLTELNNRLVRLAMGQN